MHKYIQNSNAYDFQDFIKEFSKLKTNFKEIITSFYSGNIFTSKEAKQQILQPDLKSFNE